YWYYILHLIIVNDIGHAFLKNIRVYRLDSWSVCGFDIHFYFSNDYHFKSCTLKNTAKLLQEEMPNSNENGVSFILFWDALYQFAVLLSPTTQASALAKNCNSALAGQACGYL
ncbi:MAG: hypothetical protein NTX36_11880, partial [Proteobacteria bacterium]|nr:hypothetical protein [Pseudomonadota bacterium]